MRTLPLISTLLALPACGSGVLKFPFESDKECLLMLKSWCKDGDGDGFGTIDGTPEEALCRASEDERADGQWTDSQGNVYVEDCGDCDDEDREINPEQPDCDQASSGEVDNSGVAGQDDNCDDSIDEGELTTCYLDNDEDGHWTESDAKSCASDGESTSSCVTAEDAGEQLIDCDDNDSAIRPDAVEICGNRVDEDCDDSDACAIQTGLLSDYSDYVLASDVEHADLGGIDLEGDGQAELVYLTLEESGDTLTAWIADSGDTLDQVTGTQHDVFTNSSTDDKAGRVAAAGDDCIVTEESEEAAWAFATGGTWTQVVTKRKLLGRDLAVGGGGPWAASYLVCDDDDETRQWNVNIHSSTDVSVDLRVRDLASEVAWSGATCDDKSTGGHAFPPAPRLAWAALSPAASSLRDDLIVVVPEDGGSTLGILPDAADAADDWYLSGADANISCVVEGLGEGTIALPIPCPGDAASESPDCVLIADDTTVALYPWDDATGCLGTSIPSIGIIPSAPVTSMADVGDVNGDGARDLLVTGGEKAWLYLWNGLTYSLTATLTGDAPLAIGGDDMDGDGHFDVALLDDGDLYLLPGGPAD